MRVARMIELVIAVADVLLRLPVWRTLYCWRREHNCGNAAYVGQTPTRCLSIVSYLIVLIVSFVACANDSRIVETCDCNEPACGVTTIAAESGNRDCELSMIRRQNWLRNRMPACKPVI